MLSLLSTCDIWKQSDGGTFTTSQFGFRLTDGRLDLPDDKAPPECPNLLPYVFVADEAFPLMRNIMRPYPGKKIGARERVYNYRLSRARRVVENAFGILAARFRVFHRTLDQRPDTVDRIVKATCVLHNMLQKDNVISPALFPDLQEDVDDDSLAAGLLLHCNPREGIERHMKRLTFATISETTFHRQVDLYRGKLTYDRTHRQYLWSRIVDMG